MDVELGDNMKRISMLSDPIATAGLLIKEWMREVAHRGPWSCSKKKNNVDPLLRLA